MYVHMLLQKSLELYFAAMAGNVTEVEELIQSGAYVDSTNDVVSWQRIRK